MDEEFLKRMELFCDSLREIIIEFTLVSSVLIVKGLIESELNYELRGTKENADDI